jgi:hypothetical protein
MFNLSKLLAALGTLAQSIVSLSSTVDEVNNTLRQRLALDHAGDLPLLERQPGQGGTGEAQEVNGLAGKSRRGRRGTKTA